MPNNELYECKSIPQAVKNAQLQLKYGFGKGKPEEPGYVPDHFSAIRNTQIKHWQEYFSRKGISLSPT